MKINKGFESVSLGRICECLDKSKYLFNHMVIHL